MSGIIRRQFVVPTGTVTENVLAGDVFEFIQRPSSIRLFLNQEVVAGSLLAVDLNIGNVIAFSAARPNIAVTAGVIDRSVDGFTPAVAMPQDRLQLRARETTGGAGANGLLNLLIEIADLR